VPAQVRTTPADAPPDQETLRRLAQQLGAGQSGPIDPEMVKLAEEWLQKNPQLQNDPAFQQKVAEMRQRIQQDPAYGESLKQKLNLSPEQLNQFKEQFQNGQGGPRVGGPTTRPDLPPSLRPDPTGRPPATTSQNPFQGGPQGNNKIPPQFQPPSFQPQPGQPSFQPLDPAAAKQLAENNKDFAQVAGFWEANIGSLDNTPALRQSLVEMFSGTGKSPFDGMGAKDGTNPFSGMGGSGQGGTGKPWWDTGGGANSSGGFSKWFNNLTSNGGPSWWKSMTGSGSGPSWWSGATSGGGSGFSAPSTSGFGGGAGFSGIGAGGVTGLGTVGVVVVVLILAAVIGFLVYRYWPQIQAMRTKPKALPGLGEWPIDPRDVKDRETLVRAFEYFSVFLCGDGARVWNHVTIAEAFRENVPASEPFADQLARLYAVARYTPAREEIAASDIAAARRFLCRLAGVSEA
jgi:hypothetical protein